tara:strand:+ start:815 stop:1000 length:186 start_codon:yes stop_codon:yes gene_type:complete
MIVRTFDNRIMEINRCDYNNDEEYYCDIAYYVYNIKFSKNNETMEKITDLFKKKSNNTVSK